MRQSYVRGCFLLSFCCLFILFKSLRPIETVTVKEKLGYILIHFRGQDSYNKLYVFYSTKVILLKLKKHFNIH